MARVVPVWGIEIGQCALKALKCQAHSSEPKRLVAEAFDYIEYPKILSQPDADPAALVQDALATFLSRNTVKGSQVAISVSGQSGLARFFKLPPVESKKIPLIVQYEAKQQIPFSLDDVVWDYQQMAGGSEDDGFAMETEVGLCAMKRDQVQRALNPYNGANIPVDYIQLAPLAIYNYAVFDQMPNLPPVEEYNPESPPPSIAVLSLGTDTSDLVITNGYRVWVRSLPIGGNHFTKALTKELRLTFAKAEHLKKNAPEADDPKAIYQAMRPVFTDLTTQVQMSINYFRQLDRKARIAKLVAIGNAIKLPGLQKYLQQNLGLDCPIESVSSYKMLEGDHVTSTPVFKDNLLSFAVCYGLVAQGLGKGAMRTNLIPREIIKDRMIRAKKPWVAASVAALMLGASINYFGQYRAYSLADQDGFKGPIAEAGNVQSQFNKGKQEYETSLGELKLISDHGERLTQGTDGRLLWLELLKAISAASPTDKKPLPTDVQKAEDIGNPAVLFIEDIQCHQKEDVGEWYKTVASMYAEQSKFDQPAASKPVEGEAGSAAGPAAPADPATTVAVPPVAPPATTSTTATPPATPSVPVAADGTAAPPAVAGDLPPGPTGKGWIVQIRGYHLHNQPVRDEVTKKPELIGKQYVQQTLIKNLLQGSVDLPGSDGKLHSTKISDLGVAYPVNIDQRGMEPIPLRDADKEAAGKNNATNPLPSGPGRNPISRGPLSRPVPSPSEADRVLPSLGKVMMQRFTVQFYWLPTPLSAREKKAQEAAQAASTATAATGGA